MAELAFALQVDEFDRLDQAEALVRAYCGWHIAPSRPDTFRVPALCDSRLILPSLHVTAIGSITVGDTVLVAGVDYVFTLGGVVTFRSYTWGGTWGPWVGAGWATQWPGVDVEFTHGFEEPPPDVAAVVQGCAQRAVDNPGSLMSRTRGPFTDTFGSPHGMSSPSALTLTASDLSTLARYKLPPRP